MSVEPACHDALYRLAQAGDELGVRLVRLGELIEANRYWASALEFDADGELAIADEPAFAVLNLAEPADQPGTIPPDTDAVALDAEGKWIVFVRPAGQEPTPATPLLVGRIVEALGNASYRLRVQDLDSQGQWTDRSGPVELTAANLAEQSLGPGAALDVDTRVVLVTIEDLSDPPVTRYVFDHPAYAKYLD